MSQVQNVGPYRTPKRAHALSRAARLVLLRGWLPVTLLIVWWFASKGSHSLYFPSLEQILGTMRADWLGPHFAADLVPSIVKFLVGFVIAAVLGIGLGTLIGLFPVARAVTEPFIQFLRSLPPPVLLPIGLLLFGIGATMNVAIIVMGAIWPTLLNTIDGVRSLDPQLVDVGRSYRLTFRQRILYLVLPNAGPQIFAGLRTTLQMSIILIVVSEMVASTNGIGYFLLQSQQTFAVAETWSSTLVLGILGYLAAVAFMRVERSILRWQTGLREAQGRA